MRFALVFSLALVASGCAWFGESEQERALRTGSSEPSMIPEGLDTPDFVDLLPIPEVVDYRGLGESEIEIGVPEALSGDHGVDQIVIRKLGDDQWIFFDLPSAIVWPLVVRYFEEQNIPLAALDAQGGTMETEWAVGSGNTPEEILEALKLGQEWTRESTASRHKFRVRVESGVRAGSTEVHMTHRELRAGAPFRADAIDWSTASDDADLEATTLTKMAYFVSERVVEGPSISLGAGTLQGSKATLEPRPEGMVLRYKLTFDRAWATVGAALERAEVTVEDLDRSAAKYFVYYTGRDDDSPGFLRRLFTREDDEIDPSDRFEVHMEQVGEEIHVTVVASGETDTMQVLRSERLLKLIKEYST